MGKVVIRTGLYMDKGSNRQTLYCTEGKKKKKTLENHIKDLIKIPDVDFKGIKTVDPVKLVAGLTFPPNMNAFKNAIITTKAPDKIATAVSKSLKVKITIEW